MIEKRRVFNAGATLIVALGIGHFAQQGDARVKPVDSGGTAQLISSAKDVSQDRSIASAIIPALPTDIGVPILVSSTHTEFSTRVAALDQYTDTSVQSDVQTPPPFVLACDISMTSTPATGAMIDLDLLAPCHRNTVVSIHHAGLEFSGITNESGKYQALIPAMEKNASVTVEFGNGQSATTETVVPALDGYARAALLWSGNSDLHIHALEFGADYGETGHVWFEEPRSPEFGLSANGGFLTRLGEANDLNAKFVEVYSFPADRAIRSGAVRIIVEAGVTAGACGKDITGRIIEVDAGGLTSKTGLVLAMPDCDAIGGYLVLKNLLQDLRIARN